MAKLDFRGRNYRTPNEVRSVMTTHGLTYEHWGPRALGGASDSAVLQIYAAEVERLKQEGGYQSVDLVALDAGTPGLAAITAKFREEHHHCDDEVRLTVEGEGVFEINVAATERLKLTTEPGDLIVIPAWRRHLFYLTDLCRIRTIRLFKSQAGWEAIYAKPDSH